MRERQNEPLHIYKKSCISIRRVACSAPGSVARQGDVRKRQNALYKTKEAFDDETLFVLLKQYAP